MIDVERDLLAEDEDCKELCETSVYTVVKAKIWDQDVDVLLDTGSMKSCINEKFYEQLKSGRRDIEEIPVQNVRLTSAVGTRTQRVKTQAIIPLAFCNVEQHCICLVVPNLIYNVVLGIDWLAKVGCNISYEQSKIEFRWGEDQQLITYGYAQEKNKFEACINCIQMLECGEEDSLLCGIYDENEKFEEVIKESNLCEARKKELLCVLKGHSYIFNGRLGKARMYEHKLNIIDESRFEGPKYAVPHAYVQAVDTAINTMLNEGVIERSTSCYLNPIVIVPKQDGSIRICLDARMVNQRIPPDYERPENIEQLIQEFTGKKFFSTVDLSNSFWQIPLCEYDRKFTAFLHRGQVYQFLRVPFGLRTASSALIRALNIALGEETRGFVTCYVDDLVITSRTFEEHLEHLHLVFEKLENAGFTLKLKKSRFCRDEIVFLGHTISERGVMPEKTRLDNIVQFRKPRNVKQLRSFLGVCGYFRRFLPNFSRLMEPLRELLKKDTRWAWNSMHDEAFSNIKNGFTKAVTLAYPQDDVQFIIFTDACNYGIAGALCQETDEGELRIVSLASRGLNAAEKKYTTSEQELLAIVYVLGKFRNYVLGRKFVIKTDHRALTFLRTCKISSNRMSRWILAIQEYDFDIEHIPGKDNILADFLSRNPHAEEKQRILIENEEIIICAMRKDNRSSEKLKLKDLKREQMDDQEVGHIFEKLAGAADNTYVEGKKEFKMVQGFLATKHHKDTWKIIVPKSLQEDMVWYYHFELGHFGAGKIIDAILENFIWRKMSRHVRKVLATCEVCQKSKHPVRSLEGRRLAVLRDKPGELVCVDLFGPLVKSKYGFQYIFVVIDAFSKFVKLYPLRRATSRACTNKMIKEYIPEFGVPVEVLSDHGTQFTANTWKNHLEGLGIRCIYSSIRYPQGNLSERVMREIGRMFRTYNHEKHFGWYDNLKFIEKCFNSVTHSSTAFTPWEIQYGRRPVREIVQELGLTSGLPCDKEGVITLARDNLVKAGEVRSRAQRNKHHDTLEVGEKVLLRVPGSSSLEQKLSKKFFRLFTGPYTVAKRNGNAYVLVDGDKTIGTFNIFNLRKFVQ